MTKYAAITASAAVILCLAVAGAFVMYGQGRECGGSVIAGGEAAIGGPFTLVNAEGETVTDKDVIDGPTLIYFGFTYCPDVCPMDTARNAEVIDLLDERGVDVTPVFISIDPARDTPDVVGEWAKLMHPRMVGLTGSPEQVDTASKAYKTYYRKNGEGEDYLMDHSTFSYLVGPDGFIDFFRRDIAPEQMADRIVCHVG